MRIISLILAATSNLVASRSARSSERTLRIELVLSAEKQNVVEDELPDASDVFENIGGAKTAISGPTVPNGDVASIDVHNSTHTRGPTPEEIEALLSEIAFMESNHNSTADRDNSDVLESFRVAKA